MRTLGIQVSRSTVGKLLKELGYRLSAKELVYLVRKNYAKAVKISDEQMSRLCIEKHQTLPRWNCTFAPNKNAK